ncbi:MAG: hypothetical protein DRO15_06465 [Thermoprotei archaeon]|nr:MAG: hypothetical protein DRO15_06465 [Thermoprotei archaeon]
MSLKYKFRDVRRGLKEFWLEYRRYKIGLAGLGLLIILITLALLPLIIVPIDIREHWSENPRWAFNPKLAPPEWINLLSAEKRAPPINIYPTKTEELWKYISERLFERYKSEMNITDPETLEQLKKTIEEAVKREYEYKGYIYTFNYEFEWDVPSDNVILIVQGITEKLTISAMLIRPDNLSIALYTDYGYVPIQIVKEASPKLGNETFIGEPYMAISLQFNTEFAKGVIEFLKEFEDPKVLSEMEALIKKGAPSPVAIAFYKAGPGMVYGTTGVLKGNYTFIVEIEASEQNVTLKKPPKIWLRIPGSCFGILGTDGRGRDNAITIMLGSQLALLVGITYGVAVVFMGLIYGIISAYAGGLVDEVMQRINEIVYSLPVLPFLILFSYYIREIWGVQPNIWHIVMLLLIFGWTGTAIIVRSMALSIKEQPYIEAARAIGASNWRIVFKHIMPQLIPYTFAAIALAVPGAILMEAGLSFLGLTDPTMPSWGRMLSEAQEAMFAWWWIIPPGLMITVTGLAFVFIGNALDTILNPKLRRY